MTAPNPRDPRLRRGQGVDPLAAAVRLSMSADAMRGDQLERGPQLPPPWPPVVVDVETVDEWPTVDESWQVTADPDDDELRKILAAAVQGGTHEPRLTAAEFAAALADVPEPPAAPVIPAPSAPAFSSERSRPRPTWRSRPDPRAHGFGVRRPGGVVTGSTPLQERLLPTGPILDQAAAGTTLEEQSCCTGAGTVAAINTLQLLKGGSPVLNGLEEAEAVYQRGQQLDEYPGDDYAGGSVTGAMNAAVELGLAGGFLWDFGTRDIAQTILAGHPVVVGIPWRSGMWETGPGGLVVITGDDEGLGHCLAIVGITLKGPQGQPGPFFRWQNSAGESYGDGGFGYIHHRDLAGLLHGRGEAAVPTLERQAAP